MTELLVNIDVPDLEAAQTFYCAALDLRPRRRLGPGIVELAGATAMLFLLAKPAGSQATLHGGAVRDYRRHWTPVHLDVVVPDIRAAVARAVAAGAVQEGEVGTYAWGRIAHLADPFGNGFCLIQFVGRGYDAIATPEPQPT